MHATEVLDGLATPVAAAPATGQLAGLEQLLALSRSWERALVGRRSPMEDFEWTAAAAQTFAPDCRTFLIHRDGEPAAIAPMVLRRFEGTSFLRMVGVDELHEPMDLIYRDEQALGQLAETLLAQGRPIFLERLPAESLAPRVFQRVLRGRALVVTRPKPSSPSIRLDERWLKPEEQMTSNRRGALRRNLKKALRIGPVETKVIIPTLDNLDELRTLAFEIEARSWKGLTGTALKKDRALAEFYRNYLRRACERGILRMCFFHIGGKPTAMQIALEACSTFWTLKIGYDQEYASCSPGQLLNREMIIRAVQLGLKRFEFLGTVAPWTHIWTSQEQKTVCVRIYPYRPRGLAAMGLKGMFWLGARLRKKPGPPLLGRAAGEAAARAAGGCPEENPDGADTQDAAHLRQ